MKFVRQSLLFVFLCSSIVFSQPFVHNAHLSSSWYLQNKEELRRDIKNYFALAKEHFSFVADASKVKALIVPHAGYYYSGLCAASAFQSIGNEEAKNKKIKRVIILAPSHNIGFSGIALPAYDLYKTVLGTIPVDKDVVTKLALNSVFKVFEKAHLGEHSVEVQLPFLQTCIEEFTIVPLIIGWVSETQLDLIAETLAKYSDDTTLIVVSSDFIHYGESFGYTPFQKNVFAKINQTNSRAIEAVVAKSSAAFASVIAETGATICGRDAIAILLRLIEKGGLGQVESRLTSYYSSPQLTLARANRFTISKLYQSVSDYQASNGVSYAGIVFTQDPVATLNKEDSLTSYEKGALLQLARDSIVGELKNDRAFFYPVLSEGLKRVAGAFVTLNKRSGDLRGCIGKITTGDPLYITISEMAKAAAFQDTRFSPVTMDEVDNIVIDCTVLTAPKKVTTYKDIQLGRHGIILKHGLTDAVFLPQVPGSFGWTLEETLGHLSEKAGLARETWRAGTEFEVFEGFEFKESFQPKA